jgi:RNA polymerase sigma factor (sigma-70 family)
MADHRFATTRWSLVLTAAGGESSRSRQALGELCEAYWYPLYAFIRRRGHTPEQAADLTQGYLLRVLEKGYLKQVTPEAGKFRSFLFASVQHYLSNQHDRERAVKRGGGRTPLSLDADAAEGRYRIEPADGLTPERLFERRWALEVLQRAMARLREEAVRTGDARRFEKLKTYVTGEDSAPAYREAAAELGMTETAVAVAVHRMRKQFGQRLRNEIAETVADPREIDEEIRHLLAALSS